MTDHTLHKYKLLIVDLDNTLYNEFSYLSEAYGSIAADLSVRYRKDEAAMKQYLIAHFQSGGRQKLFDRFLDAFDLPVTEMRAILSLLRNVSISPAIELSDTAKVLVRLSVEKQDVVCILTNGNREQQANKIANIHWPIEKNRIDVCFAVDHGSKPLPNGVFYFLDKYQMAPQDVVMIGDDASDEQCAVAAGIDFLNVNLYERVPDLH